MGIACLCIERRPPFHRTQGGRGIRSGRLSSSTGRTGAAASLASKKVESYARSASRKRAAEPSPYQIAGAEGWFATASLDAKRGCPIASNRIKDLDARQEEYDRQEALAASDPGGARYASGGRAAVPVRLFAQVRGVFARVDGGGYDGTMKHNLSITAASGAEVDLASTLPTVLTKINGEIGSRGVALNIDNIVLLGEAKQGGWERMYSSGVNVPTPINELVLPGVSARDLFAIPRSMESGAKAHIETTWYGGGSPPGPGKAKRHAQSSGHHPTLPASTEPPPKDEMARNRRNTYIKYAGGEYYKACSNYAALLEDPVSWSAWWQAHPEACAYLSGYPSTEVPEFPGHSSSRPPSRSEESAPMIGQRIVIQNLTSKAHLNGKRGTVLGVWDNVKNSFREPCDGDERVAIQTFHEIQPQSLKRTNFQCMGLVKPNPPPAPQPQPKPAGPVGKPAAGPGWKDVLKGGATGRAQGKKPVDALTAVVDSVTSAHLNCALAEQLGDEPKTFRLDVLRHMGRATVITHLKGYAEVDEFGDDFDPEGKSVMELRAELLRRWLGEAGKLSDDGSSGHGNFSDDGWGDDGADFAAYPSAKPAPNPSAKPAPKPAPGQPLASSVLASCDLLPCSPCVHSFCARLVCTPSVLLVCTPSVLASCALLPCSPRVHSLCAPLVCTVSQETHRYMQLTSPRMTIRMRMI